MRKFDDYGLKICRYQGNLFAGTLETVRCSTPVFIRRFMLSRTAERMDHDGFMFGALSEAGAIAEINAQFGESDYGQIKYSEEELYWIGYIYRYWSYTREISSKALYRQVKPSELRSVYFPYHSLDPAQAIERILESKGLREKDMIERGVAILKKLRAAKEM